MRIGRLERELASSRAHLESVIIEQEAANEEVVASNEELQSLNEELESSKEELEATNEELTTVNQELQVRNTELENAREFAQATIDTVRGSLVVLGRIFACSRPTNPFTGHSGSLQRRSSTASSTNWATDSPAFRGFECCLKRFFPRTA